MDYSIFHMFFILVPREYISEVDLYITPVSDRFQIVLFFRSFASHIRFI